MGDHLALSLDHLLTDSTPEATIESRKRARNAHRLAAFADPTVDFDGEVGRVVECRICQEEDEGRNMEIPCSCRGSLKYAHRNCVQRWCNEKGDTTCEICLQQFEPGYTAPPLFQYGCLPMDFRDFRDSQIITMAPSDHGIPSTYENGSFPDDQSTIRCGSVAIIFITLLVLRHSLPFLLNGAEDYTLPMFLLLVLRTAGILVPAALIARSLTIYKHRRRQQGAIYLSQDLTETVRGLALCINLNQILFVSISKWGMSRAQQGSNTSQPGFIECEA